MNDRVAQAVLKMQAAGKRATPERTLLIEIITNHPHLDADQIYRIAREQHPSIGLATVYRTLNVLKEFDVIRANELGENHAHFELRDEEHIHLVCTTCGKILDIPAPASLTRIAEQQGFEVKEAHFEWFGRCAACASAQAEDQ